MVDEEIVVLKNRDIGDDPLTRPQGFRVDEIGIDDTAENQLAFGVGNPNETRRRRGRNTIQPRKSQPAHTRS